VAEVTGLALLLLCGAFLLTDALLWESGVTERNFRRVRVGMTLEKVETLFGSRGNAYPHSSWERGLWFWSDPKDANRWAGVEVRYGRVAWGAWTDGTRRREIPGR
jgi:hypothetical protein